MSAEWIPSLWSATFNETLEEELEYTDRWTFQFNYTLQQRISQDERRRGWKVYCYCADGDFRCNACSRTWHSARITLLFHYRLHSSSERGTVIMRPFGQMCSVCNRGFVQPGFSTKEIKEVLVRLIGKIKKNCYGEEETDRRNSGSSENVQTKPHESSLCEACHQGICCAEDMEPS